jgi:hypothetical protein
MNHHAVIRWTVFLASIGLALFALLAGGQALAQERAPAAPLGSPFSYQGQLKDSAGNPISDSCDLRFILYDAELGGAQVGPIQEKAAVAVAGGYCTSLLDFGSAAFNGDARWLEVAVKCSGEADYTILTPRQPLTAAPYATYAQTVGSHSHWGDTWSGNGTGLSLSGGTTGLSGHGSTYGVEGISASTSGYGVFGHTSATSGWTTGVFGQSDSTDGKGVFGNATATSGETYGVFGKSDSTDGFGVEGESPLIGVRGWATGTSGWAGVYGKSDSTEGRGVIGWVSSTGGATNGVRGLSDSSQGTGVYGEASAPSGSTYGVFGISASTDGYGVHGEAPIIGVRGYATGSSGWAAGVYGKSDSTEGRGVIGWAPSTNGRNFGVAGVTESAEGKGVEGTANATSGTNYGVYGASGSTAGYGVYGQAPLYGVKGLATDTSEDYVTYGVIGQTDTAWGIGVYGLASAASAEYAYGVYGAANSPSGYGVYSHGNFAASGTKAAVVDTLNYGWLHLYAVESPDVLFEDVGTAQLVEGAAIVTIDPKFAETVNLNVPYQVFVTPLGDCALYVTDKTAASFTVRALGGAKCNLAFDFQLIAKRLGYEDVRTVSPPLVGVRMAPAVSPPLVDVRAADPNQALQSIKPTEEPQP